jgi:hypothetical protein
VSLVLRLSMVASVDVTSLLEGIDTSTPAPIHAQRIHVVSPIALPPHLIISLTTILPLGFCTQYLLSGAPHQRLALSSSRSLECFTSSYAGLWGPWSPPLDLPVLLLMVLCLWGFLPQWRRWTSVGP